MGVYLDLKRILCGNAEMPGSPHDRTIALWLIVVSVFPCSNPCECA